MASPSGFRVVLVSPYEINSFALRILHPLLARAGFEVVSVYFKRYRTDRIPALPSAAEYEHLAATVADLRPDLVGITVRTVVFGVVRRMLRTLRSRVTAPVILGGIDPTIRPRAALEIADLACVGEGEALIVELARRLSTGESIDDLPNLAFRRNGEMVCNPSGPLLQDLDSLPWIDYSDDSKLYLDRCRVLERPPGADRDQTFRTMASRGCPFGCSFCVHSILRQRQPKGERYVRRRSVGDVIGELTHYLARHPKTGMVKFYDDVFTVHREWIKEFSLAYKRHVDRPFFCYLYPTCVDEEILWHLKYAGLRYVTVGVQSGSSRVRREVYHRAERDERIIATAALLKKFDLWVAYDAIVGSPYEVEADLAAAVDLFLRLPKPFKVSVHAMAYFPHYEITERALAEGLISESDILGSDDRVLSLGTFWPALLKDRRKQYTFGVLKSLGHPDIPNRWIERLADSDLVRRQPWILWLHRALAPPLVRGGGRRLGLRLADSRPTAPE